LFISFLLGLIGTPPAALAQVDPVVLGHAIDSTVKLSIIVRGTVDGEEQIIWYGVGSGTVVSPDGVILTNQHLITPRGVQEKLAELKRELAKDGKSAEVDLESERVMVATSDGRHLPQPRYVATVVAEDADLDLAVLRIDGDEREHPLSSPLTLPVLPLGDSDAVNLGDPVHVFGFPAIGSGSLTYTAGVVSSFLYEDGIDGTAWINTDAVTSGGNSGGAAVNAAGELIGIPTSGSALDCRPGDTNGDGVQNAEDVGCVPTGGSLAQLRPINLAKPLLASIDPRLVSPAAGAAVGTPSTNDALASRIAAAKGCAARGDWRCAANFYADALVIAPDDAGLAASLYDAFVALGKQEEGAGRLESARSAFSDAQSADPSRNEAAAALERIAPYRHAILVDSFDGSRRYTESSEEGATSAYETGAFRLELSRPGVVTGYPLTATPLAGENYAVLLEIGESSGDGMVTVETRTDPDGGQWVFAVDPTRQTWEVLQFDTESGQFGPWSEAHDYHDPDANLTSVELRVTEGFPTLLVDGVDVAAEAGVALPEVGNVGDLSFGALMESEGTVPFSVSFDQVGLYELA
jgi:S1-C subfamily serine protease